MSGNIDWSYLITSAMKEQAAKDQVLAAAVAENAKRRAVADRAIAPLQDAVDIDEATDAEVLLLKAWKKYRVALSRVPEQVGYPSTIEWPTAPA
ncbi:tail fiber assembly protein [Pseudomonas sp. Irchel s3b5]|uniref:tail fiber assembly protein n=1 Tax=Pseudomonas sp. Irchel s3b5 TaxID=2009077 RepID=UPI000BA440A2|nr:tail fiber assembly protein [Pseudomonas sp. Irchel s3b5]